MFKKAWSRWCMVLLAVFMAGCSSGGDSGSQQGTGTLVVSLTDAPACGFDAVNVTVSKVRVHQSSSASENDADWADITLSPAKKINLLNLTNGALEHLGETSLRAGHYTQLRLVLSANTGTVPANSVVLSGATTTAETTEIELDTPSAVQSGIKLVNEFDVAPGQRVDLVLDFDACKSVVKRGNGTYGLKPVIKIIPTALTGIDGFVDTSLLGSNVMVSAQSGTTVSSTVPNAQTGEFFLARLAPGSYDVVITADDHATAVIAGVPVSSASSTALVSTVSTTAEPITLPTSTTRTISGSVRLNPAGLADVAYVATKQTFTAGPTVTIKSLAVDPVSGPTYTFTLPVDAPLLGQFGDGSLPIAFAAQPDVAGIYTVEASAAGYQTQPFSVDISAVEAVQNFVLTQ